MSPETLLEHFDVVAKAPSGAHKLRELILRLAVRGKLVTQDSSDEPVNVLVKRIRVERQRLQADGKTGEPKKLPPIRPDEVPFGVPDGWEWVRLAAVADHRLGKMLDKNKNQGELYPYLRNTNVQWLRYDLKDVKKIRLRSDELEEYRVLAGDLLVCEGGEPGRCAVWEDSEREMFYQKALHRVRPFGGIEPRYILLCLRADALSDQLIPYFTGATIKHMTGQALARYAFPLPPLPEQRRILEKVDQLMARCDELEERQRRSVQKRDCLNRSALYQLTTAGEQVKVARHWLRIRENFDVMFDAPATIAELRQAIVQLAVRGKLLPQALGEEPASILLERIQAEKRRLTTEGVIAKPKQLPPIIEVDLPFEIQAGWVWARLGTVVLDIEAGWSPSCEARPRRGDEWGVLKISSVSWGRFDPDENKALPAHLEPRERFEVRQGDFLMSRANTADLVGRSVVVEDTPPRLLLNDKTLRVLVPVWVERRYLNLYNNSTFARAYYAATASGTSSSMRNLSREQIQSLLVPIPPLPQQRRIVERVDQLMALCDELEAKLTCARTKSEHLAASLVHHLTAA